MKLLEKSLLAYQFDPAAIGQLADWASSGGFALLDENDFAGMQAYLQQYPMYQALVPLLTDQNSNYFCVYVSGPLKGMVCYLGHDEPDVAPRFRSIAALLHALAQHPDATDLADFEASAFDFPLPPHSPDAARCQQIAAALTADFRQETDEDRRVQLAYSLMALTPPENLASLYPFLDDEDMYIQERAIETLGFHRYQPAAERLQALLTTAQSNGRTAAKIALQRLHNA